MFFYLFLFRARPFPRHYHLMFDDRESEINEPKQMNIYSVRLPMISDLAKPKDFDKYINFLNKSEIKELEKVKENKEIPYILVNPFVEGGRFCVMDHLMIANVVGGSR